MKYENTPVKHFFCVFISLDDLFKHCKAKYQIKSKNISNKDINEVSDDEMIKDIGIKTSRIYKKLISEAATIIWNGPVGVFENTSFEDGTKDIAISVSKASALTIAGGGDTISAIEKFIKKFMEKMILKKL